MLNATCDHGAFPRLIHIVPMLYLALDHLKLYKTTYTVYNAMLLALI